MKVKELMKQLSTLNPNLEIEIRIPVAGGTRYSYITPTGVEEETYADNLGYIMKRCRMECMSI